MLKIAFSQIYKYDLPEKHRFPMEKYELLPEQLLYEGTVVPANFFNPGPIDERIILQTHEKDYWEKLKNLQLTAKEIRAIGFPMSSQLIKRGKHIAQGTLLATEYALKYGIAMNIAGGTHHSFSYKGEGFCLLNDIAIAANYLISQKGMQKILIVDLDVHQGNGTAQIFKDTPSVFTFSMHGAKNYPTRKEISDLDIGLPDKTEDRQYLKTLKSTLPYLIDLTEPDFIFYLAGVDILETDKLGRLSVSLEGCKERDEFVLETCKKNEIPLVVSMGGGYSVKTAHIIDAHANTYRAAQKIFF